MQCVCVEKKNVEWVNARLDPTEERIYELEDSVKKVTQNIA